MRYFFCTLIGLALMVASCVALAYSVYQLLQIGTCASGGPYEVARECPGGTERLGLAIPVAVITMLIGLGLYAARGRAPGSDRDPRPGIGLVVMWCGIFFGIAFAAFWGVWGPDANPGPGRQARRAHRRLPLRADGDRRRPDVLVPRSLDGRRAEVRAGWASATCGS